MQLLFMEGFDTIETYNDFAEYGGTFKDITYGALTTTTENARASGYGNATPRCAKGTSSGSTVALMYKTVTGKNALHVGGAWRFTASSLTASVLLTILVDGKYVTIWFAPEGDGYKIGVKGSGATVWQSAEPYIAINAWHHLEVTVLTGTTWTVNVYLDDGTEPIVTAAETPASAPGNGITWVSWGNVLLDDLYLAAGTDGVLKSPRYGPCYCVTNAPSGSNLSGTPWSDFGTGAGGVANISETGNIAGDSNGRRATATGKADEWEAGITGLGYGTVHAVQLFTHGKEETTPVPVTPYVRRPGQVTKDGGAIVYADRFYPGHHDIFETNESGAAWAHTDVQNLRCGYRT